MKGTYLDKLWTDYIAIGEEILTIDRSVETSKSELPVLKQQVEEYQEKIRLLQQLKSTKESIDQLKKELAWSQVREEEAKLDAIREQLDSVETSSRDKNSYMQAKTVRKETSGVCVFYGV